MSIFAEQLKFEPLTDRRKILLKIDVASLVLCLCLTYVILFIAAHQPDIKNFFLILLAPLSEWFRTHLWPAIGQFLRTCFPEQMVTSMLSGFKAVMDCAIGVLRIIQSITRVVCHPIFLVVTYGFVIAYHSGLIGPLRSSQQGSSVLMHELRRLRVRFFEPRINIGITGRSTISLVVTAFVLTMMTFSCLFVWVSGILASTGWLVMGLTEPGFNNWFMACLRDAHIAFPQTWDAYSNAWMLERRDLMYLLFTIKEAPVMPPDLFKVRLFFAALFGVVAAIPYTLSCISTGIDSFSSRSWTLTPTRLIQQHRTFYFLYFSKVFYWEKLLTASLDNSRGHRHLVLSFTNNKKVRINLDKLEDKQKSTLIQGLDELAPSCQFSSEIRALFEKSRKESSAGYTLFWDDELAKQRRATVFVPLEQGARLKGGDLEVLRQLSGQGWSCTYLARYNGDFVVLRESVLSDETSSGKRALETLEKEAKILGSLNHQSIARVLDFFVENQRSYLMLEYVVGQDLRKKVGLVGQVDECKTIEIGIEVCNILQYLHESEPQVLHRDISPDNLVLTANGQLRLIDFAAAKQFIENATGTMIGKRSYMAPEQLRGKASVRSDVYSLGATMYFLLTGKDPVALSECHILMQRPELSNELDQLIGEMTSFDENNRPESVVIVREKLQQILIKRRPAGGALLEAICASLLGHDGFTINLNSRVVEKEPCK